jgi:hypothetical protein
MCLLLLALLLPEDISSFLTPVVGPSSSEQHLIQHLRAPPLDMLRFISGAVLSARAFAKSPMQKFTFSTTPVVEKLKTHKGAAKRWKAIANGNVSPPLNFVCY